MQETDKNKENDLFCEIIKDKLADYTLPVDDDSWNKIAEHLNPALRRKTLQRWIAAVAVAASIALLFIIFSIDKKNFHHETANQLSNNEKTIIQDIHGKEIIPPLLPRSAENLSLNRKFRPGERLAENNLTTEVTPKEEIVENNPAVPAEEKKSNSPEKHPVTPNTYYDFEKETETPPPTVKHKNRQSIRFSIGSGGNFLANNAEMSVESSNFPLDKPNYSMMSFQSNVLNAANSNSKEILLNENYPNVNYHLPLSFGITVKKELNRRFAVESGIVYSFLETTFSKDLPKSTASLQLHYLGIPLNIHTHIFGNRFSPWKVYISTGGMVEKGLLLHFAQKIFYNDNNNTVTTVKSNEKIDGLQWSLGISPGIDYQIHKNYSIYLEPKVSYYFDNNQPVSIRTQHPVVIGINAGVRYTW